jgi:hypothetical protein
MRKQTRYNDNLLVIIYHGRILEEFGRKNENVRIRVNNK